MQDIRFWHARDMDSIQNTTVLQEPMRSKDAWHNEVLQAARVGMETWEMYCFIHGLPTKNPGSWLPNLNAPTCGNRKCKDLANNVWPAMWDASKSKDWLLRQNLECDICSKERKRRCCVADIAQCKQEPFATAPYVHPFRAPAYYAQQLRSLQFAKTKACRVLWVTAFDRVKSTSQEQQSHKAEERREQWLKFHERFTNGIPGLLPLVLNLPIRFTETPNKLARQLGIFKHTRGFLCGWQLPADELERIEHEPGNALSLL